MTDEAHPDDDATGGEHDEQPDAGGMDGSHLRGGLTAFVVVSLGMLAVVRALGYTGGGPWEAVSTLGPLVGFCVLVPTGLLGWLLYRRRRGARGKK